MKITDLLWLFRTANYLVALFLALSLQSAPSRRFLSSPLATRLLFEFVFVFGLFVLLFEFVFLLGLFGLFVFSFVWFGWVAIVVFVSVAPLFVLGVFVAFVFAIVVLVSFFLPQPLPVLVSPSLAPLSFSPVPLVSSVALSPLRLSSSSFLSHATCQELLCLKETLLRCQNPATRSVCHPTTLHQTRAVKSVRKEKLQSEIVGPTTS